MTSKHYRTHQRFGARVQVTVTSVHRNASAHGSTVDLGVGGMACELDAPLRLGESVQVILLLESPRVARGQVAWVGWAEASAVRLGVRFDPASADELAQLLDALGITSQLGA